MAVFSKQSLITELLDRNELLKASSQLFLRLADDQLNFRPAPDQWSIAEIFEHLNIVDTIYTRNILSRITLAPDVQEETYTSGWLGDWLCARVMPRSDGSVLKLKARKPYLVDCAGPDGREALHRFLQQCDTIDDILRHVATKDLRRIKIRFSYTKLLHLRLGDNLRYLIAHSERHLLQAQRIKFAITGL